MLGYLTKPVEPHLRRRCNTHINSGFTSEFSICIFCIVGVMHELTKTFILQSLLCDPNPDSPANAEAARLFSENKREYNRKVREIVEQSYV